MSLVLQSTGGGTITLDTVATAANTTLTLPTGTSTVLAGTTSASTTNTVTTKVAVTIGGVVYYLLASTSGT